MRTTILLSILLYFSFFTNLLAQISVDFSANTVEICAPGIVNFTDNSASNNPIVQWEWTRDGSLFSTLQNPALFFGAPGTYDICLKVTDNLGNIDSLCLTNYIIAYQSPTANFSVNNTLGCVDLTVDFTDLSTLGDAPINDWYWDFGNGDTTSGWNPTAVYSTAGTFDVTLIVTDTNGCSDDLLQSNLITATPAITASIAYNANQIQCGIPSTITFTGISNAPNANYVWSLGDNSVATGQSIAHTYTSTGCYSPTVTVNSGFCYATATIPACINISDTPVVDFTILDTTGCSLPFSLMINNQSTGYTSLQWDFGDDNTSPLFQPIHQYNTHIPLDTARYLNGVFPVSLTATNAAGCTSTDTQLVYIADPFVSLIPNKIPCAPDTAAFIAFSTDVSAAFSITQWDFTLANQLAASGNTALAFYPDSGIYQNQVIITNSIGCQDTAYRTMEVGMTPEIDSFFANRQIICRKDGIAFQGYSNSFVDEWDWIFWDGSSSSGINPLHTFQDTGWTSGMVLASFRGCVDTMRLDSYYIHPPIALATYDITCQSLTVQFSDTSIAADSWYWDFGDTTTTSDTSTLTHPSYTYPDTGSYLAILIVTNFTTGCTDTFPLPLSLQSTHADFIIDDSLCLPAFVTPTNLSTGSEGYLWTAQGSTPFTNSSFEPPLAYYEPGIYNVMLTTFDINGCQDSIIKTIHIAGVDENILYSPIPACRPATVTITDSSTGIFSPIIAWQWDNGSTQQHTTATYVFPGYQTPSVTVTNDWGCDFVLEDSIPVGGAFINFSSNQDICLGNFLTATAITSSPANNNSFRPFTYIWDYGDGTIDTTTSTVTTYQYHTAGVYDLCLTVLDSIGCETVFCRPNWVEVHDPTALFTADTFFSSCPPLEVNFTNLSQSGTQWLWSFGDGSVSSLENPTHVYSTPGFYDVALQVDAFPGCSGQDTILQMIQITGPTGNFTMPPVNHCAPYTAALIGYGTNIANYTWLFGNGDIQTNSTNSTTDTTYYTYTQPGSYVPILVIDDGMGCQIPIEQDTIVITAPPTPAFLVDSLLCQFDSVNYQLLTSIHTTTTIEWHFQGGFPNTSTDLNPTVFYPDTGSFEVQLIVWEDGCSDTLTRNHFIKVKAAPNANFGIIQTDSCAPALVQFIDASSTMDGILQTWDWDFGNSQTSQQQDSSLWYTQAAIFSVQLIVANNFGCKDSIQQMLQTYPTPNVTIATPPTLCLGDSLQLQATGNGNLSWTSTAWLSDSTISSPITVVDSTTTYIVEISSNVGCRNSDTLTITPEPWITVLLGQDTAICFGNSIALQATGTSANFDWGTDTTLSCQFCPNPIATPIQTTVYEVHPANNPICSTMDSIRVIVHPNPIAQIQGDSALCPGDSIQLIATGGQQYDWFAGTNLSNNSIPNPIATPTNNTTYSVMVTDSNGCSDSTSWMVILNDNSFVPLNDRIICLGDSVQLTTTGNQAVWTGNALSCNNCLHPIATPIVSNTYTLQYLNTSNCLINDSLWVEVLDLTQLQILASDKLCLGDSTQLMVIGNQNIAVNWSPNYALTSTTSISPFAFPSVDTHYIVQVQQGDCSRNDSIFINILEEPIVSALGTEYCIGDSAQLFGTGNALTYQWLPSTGLSNDTILSPWVNAPHAQQYQLIGSNACGWDTAYVDVIVHSYPSVQIGDTLRAIVGTEVALAPSNTLSYTYDWSPNNDLSCNNCPDPTWMITGKGIFYVTVTNSFGCPVLDSVVIIPYDDCTPDLVFVPNAFSPNSDGHNDVLYAQSGIIQEIEQFQIYDRWGSLVFESNDWSIGWDGRYNGAELSPDVYGYFLTFRCPNTGALMLKKGNITILR